MGAHLRSLRMLAFVAAAGALWSCGPKQIELPPEGVPPCAEKGDSLGLTVPGHAGREYDIHLPPQYDCMNYQPVVLALHGTFGNKESMARTTCPGEFKGLGRMPRDPNSEGCLNHLADQENFIVVYPNGSPIADSQVRDGRSWNAGGGKGYRCVHPSACRQDVDDVAYLDAVLDAVSSRFDYDKRRVYVTGISDGGAMAYRAACEMSDKITAIAPIAAGNQFVTEAGCNLRRPVPVLHIHGADDPLWPYRGGEPEWKRAAGKHVSVCETLMGSANCAPEERTGEREFQGWMQRNACEGEPLSEEWDPNPSDSRTRVTRVAAKCPAGAEVLLLRIAGGGHTWPGGWQYFSESARGLVPGIGVTSREFSANEVMWQFFQRHSKRY